MLCQSCRVAEAGASVADAAPASAVMPLRTKPMLPVASRCRSGMTTLGYSTTRNSSTQSYSTWKCVSPRATVAIMLLPS